MPMKILINEKENLITINKSKFLGIVKKVYTKEDIQKYLNYYQKEYFDATHLCYAYILDNEKRFSDDNEPSGTAGLPILNILEKNNLNHCLAIVIRYFGGIKLGSNGLIRAYSNTINELVKENIKEEENAYLLEITENYDKSKEIDYLLKDTIILSKDYQDKLVIQVLVKEKDLIHLSSINYKIIEKRII